VQATLKRRSSSASPPADRRCNPMTRPVCPKHARRRAASGRRGAPAGTKRHRRGRQGWAAQNASPPDNKTARRAPRIIRPETDAEFVAAEYVRRRAAERGVVGAVEEEHHRPQRRRAREAARVAQIDPTPPRRWPPSVSRPLISIATISAASGRFAICAPPWKSWRSLSNTRSGSMPSKSRCETIARTKSPARTESRRGVLRELAKGKEVDAPRCRFLNDPARDEFLRIQDVYLAFQITQSKPTRGGFSLAHPVRIELIQDAQGRRENAAPRPMPASRDTVHQANAQRQGQRRAGSARCAPDAPARIRLRGRFRLGI